MRSNPKFQNICWIRFGRYQYHKCDKCTKKQECDCWYNKDTGEWLYPVIRISRPYCAPTKVIFRPIPGGIYDIEVAPYI